MTTIKFTQWQCNDDKPGIVQEDALKRVLGFSGDLATQSYDSIPDATGYAFSDAEGTYSTSTDYSILGLLPGDAKRTVLTMSGGSTSQWYRIRCNVNVSFGYVAEFSKTGNTGGFLFGINSMVTKMYLVWWDGNHAGISTLLGHVETKLFDVPTDQVSGPARVRIAVKPIAATVIDQPDDLAVTLWMDDRVIFSYAMQYDTDMGQQIGFATYHNNEVNYARIRIAQFHQIVEMTYIGPNEEAGASLGRVLGLEMMRVQARFNGAVLIWRNTLTNSVFTFTPSLIFAQSRTQNLYAPNHYRLIGGLFQGDVIQGMAGVEGTYQERGHLFTSATDPNANIEDDVFQRAKRKSLQAIEQADSLEIVSRFKPLLEAEDVITVVPRYSLTGIKWRITTIDFQASWDNGGIRYQTKMALRRMIGDL